MAPSTSNVWSPGESSLKRSSFNALVQQKEPDVSEMMMRAQNMGRQAEFGQGWTPGSIVARRLSEKLSQGLAHATPTVPLTPPIWQSISHKESPMSISMSRSLRQSSTPASPSSRRGHWREPSSNVLGIEVGDKSGQRGQQRPTMISLYKPVSMGPTKMAWGSMMPQKESPTRQASAPLLLSSSQSTCASAQGTPRLHRPSNRPMSQSGCRSIGSQQRPGSAPDGPNTPLSRGNGSTTTWRTSETALVRDSANSIFSGAKFDMPEAMMRMTAMGRQAEFGADWVPPGIHARQMADRITKRS